MKKLLLFIISVCISSMLFAQIPQGINYQAVIRDTGGKIKSNQNVEIEINILQGSADGSAIFTETHHTATTSSGVVNLIIGSVNKSSFQNIDWTQFPYFISLSLNGIHLGTNQILAVPYAFYADKAANTFSGDFNDLTNIPVDIDLDKTDDFSGDFNDLRNIPWETNEKWLGRFFRINFWDLQNIPEYLDTDYRNDFSGDFNDLVNIPENLDLNSSDDFSGNFNDLLNIPENLDLDNTDDFSGDFNDLINVPENLDLDNSDDFSGDFNDLVNIPVHLDTDNTDDFSGNFNDLINIPENLDLDNSDDFDGDYNNLTNKPNYSFFWGDKDQDGFGDTYKAIYAPEAPNGYIDNAEDCDDNNNNVYPGADEICDNLDNDCDGEIDEDAIDKQIWFLDSDYDGYGDADNFIESCFGGENYVINSDDCDDSNEQVHPNAEELCDGIDNNCNGEIDDNPIEAPTWFLDSDGDGYGNNDNYIIACMQPDGYVNTPNDCDDSDPNINPSNDEVCDGSDNDCNGQVDDNAVDATRWYFDMDEDGFGSEMGDMEIYSCEQPNGFVDNNMDCDDEDPNVNPYAEEVNDGRDNDCDGEVDEGFINECTSDDECESGYICIDGVCTVNDADMDGYPADIDCDDENPEVNQGMEEIPDDGIDNNCNGQIDETGEEMCGDGICDVTENCETCPSDCSCDNDFDLDGYDSDIDCDDYNPEVYPGATEILDGIDNDCDGLVDEYLNACGDDTDCGAGYICVDGVCEPNELTETNCFDGIDNDADGLVDCEDPDCDGQCYDEDSDGDGIFDQDDNCPFNYNPDQTDTNGDGIGDACDETSNCECGNGVLDECEECDDGNLSNGDGCNSSCQLEENNEDLDGDGFSSDVDCDDYDPEINPGAIEVVGDGIDNNCNGIVDEETNTCHSDADCGAGYICYYGECIPENSIETNCNDGIDNDGDGLVDCDDPDCENNSSCIEYQDNDMDGYTSDVDCDDYDPEINPGVEEIPGDGIDNNCNGMIDEEPNSCRTNSDCPDGMICGIEGQCEYFDADGDGYASDIDCDDYNPEVNPGMEEIPDDGIDNNCNGQVDESGEEICGNGICDASENCETCPTDCPCDEDSDGDGIFDQDDNCPFNYNPEQTDSNGDGIGDACDEPSDCECGNGIIEDCEECDDGNLSNGDGCSSSCQIEGNQGSETCNDGIINGAETDVDCGGPDCQPCSTASLCNVDSDCESGICVNGICMEASCTDGIQNGNETGVDCGGPDCAPCIIDSDGDGILDADDNCPMEFNPDQLDSDENGIGDACDEPSDCECGNGIIEDCEECDDGNLSNGDGCSSSCQLEENNEDLDDDGFTSDVDCDDTDPSIHPEAMEVCDGIDNDCNGLVDDNAVDGTIWYMDEDLDGYGNDYYTMIACEQPDGFVANNTDCDDNMPDIYPGAVEILDGMDNDCNGEIDDITTISCESGVDCPDGYYCVDGECVMDCPAGMIDCGGNCIDPSSDTEHCGSCGISCPDGYTCQNGICILNCDAGMTKCGDECVNIQDDPNHCGSCGVTCPDGYTCQYGECVPITEICNDGVDNDGDGYVDCDDLDCDSYPTCGAIQDQDGDGFTSDVDCDDSNQNIHPEANELCDGLDNNCNGIVDENAIDAVIWFADNDADGYGNPDVYVYSCEQPSGYVINENDCDDSDHTIFPGSEEVCDDIDNNCNGEIDEGDVCDTPCVPSVEICDGIDNDCDGVIDENCI